jgi:hypothetical protein
MNRRTFLAALTTLVVAMTTVMGSSRAISAQQIFSCASGCYIVDLTNVPTTCLPLCIYTSWGGGAVTWPLTASPCYTASGIYTECPVPPLAAGTPLDWVSVCGAPFIPGVYGQTSVNCGSCQLCVVLCTNSALCPTIKVYPGPCPSAPLPCP